jgi:hypothetical protein
VTTTYAALEHRFEVSCDLPILDAEIRRILGPLRDRVARPRVRYEVVMNDPMRPPYRLLADGCEVAVTTDAAGPLAHLLHRINRDTIAESGKLTLLHAAAASPAHRAVLFPASMEAGKSTLVTALVRAGWHYVTDEVVAISPTTGLVHPFPRSISLDAGSWHLFADLKPTTVPSLGLLRPAQWQIPADVIGTTMTEPVPVEAVVFPRYDAGSSTRLEPLKPVEGLRRALSCSFTLDAHPDRDVPVLARLLDKVEAYGLQVDDVADAVRLLAARFARP